MTRIETGEDITRLRKAMGWDREKLAEHLGVHVATVYRMEAGRTRPSGPTMRVLEGLAKKAPKK